MFYVEGTELANTQGQESIPRAHLGEVRKDDGDSLTKLFVWIIL